MTRMHMYVYATYERHEALPFEMSQAVKARTPFPQPMRNGYRQAIQSDNPIQLEVLALSDNLRCS